VSAPLHKALAQVRPPSFVRIGGQLGHQVRPVAFHGGAHLRIDLVNDVEQLDLLPDRIQLFRAQSAAVQELDWHGSPAVAPAQHLRLLAQRQHMARLARHRELHIVSRVRSVDALEPRQDFDEVAVEVEQLDRIAKVLGQGH
jgi:hypothetical protein